MKVLDCHHYQTMMRSGVPPALEIQPGESVVIQTRDACYGRVRSMADLERYRSDPARQTDPLTGPIFVAGARAGGSLVVDVLDIELDETGFQVLGPNRAIVRDEVSDWTCCAVQIREGMICLPGGITLPAIPCIGTLGNAPAGEPTLQPGRLGGNIDAAYIRAGVRVYLPIEVDGAFFYLGDVHARQGDGHVVGGPEIGARVTVRLDVLDENVAEWPLIETDDGWQMLTSAATDEEAIRCGVFAAARFIQARYGISFNDALVLLTMCVSLRPARTSVNGTLFHTYCTGVPKALIEQATARCRTSDH